MSERCFVKGLYVGLKVRHHAGVYGSLFYVADRLCWSAVLILWCLRNIGWGMGRALVDP
jgi:hypothetical protein